MSLYPHVRCSVDFTHRQVCLGNDDHPGREDFLNHRGIRCFRPAQGKRAASCIHTETPVCHDVVFDNDWDAVQRASCLAHCSLCIKLLGILRDEVVRRGLYDGVELESILVVFLDLC
jgi:hypothetical protein